MHSQDQLLVAESLIAFAGNARELSPRERRAWELAKQLLSEMDITEEVLVAQIDEEWSGPSPT